MFLPVKKNKKLFRLQTCNLQTYILLAFFFFFVGGGENGAENIPESLISRSPDYYPAKHSFRKTVPRGKDQGWYHGSRAGSAGNDDEGRV